MYCFAKNDKDNLDRHEVTEFKSAAAVYLGLSDAEIAAAIERNEMEEVTPS